MGRCENYCMKLGSSFLICYLIPVISFQRFLTSIFSSTEDPPAWARGTMATIQGRGGDLISQEALTHLASVYDLGMFPPIRGHRSNIFHTFEDRRRSKTLPVICSSTGKLFESLIPMCRFGFLLSDNIDFAVCAARGMVLVRSLVLVLFLVLALVRSSPWSLVTT
jgi:hypothetical protein